MERKINRGGQIKAQGLRTPQGRRRNPQEMGRERNKLGRRGGETYLGKGGETHGGEGGETHTFGIYKQTKTHTQRIIGGAHIK